MAQLPTLTTLRSRLFGSAARPALDPAPLRQASPADAAAPPPVRENMFTRAYDGFSIGAEWLDALATNADTVLKREGDRDLKLYDALLDDDVAFATFQQRQLALVSRPWTVEPGDADDPRSVQAADDLRAMINGVGWDRVCRLMFYGVWFGYGVAEAIFTVKKHDGRTIIWLDDIVVPDRSWFGFTNRGELRMRTPEAANGEPVPPNKFWTFRNGGTHDFALHGTGLAHWCYWPIWFKRNVLQFWALYLEKYGQPTAIGYFRPGAQQEDINALMAGLSAIGSDSAVAFPAPPDTGIPGTAGPDLRPQLLEAQRGGGAQSYDDFVERMNDALRGVILGQPGTSTSKSTGLNNNQTDVHKDVRDEVVKADSDALHEGFNATIPVWLTLWNYGPDVAPPTVYRNLEDSEDLSVVADRDSTLNGLGWQRTEESFKETYGDGYERKPEPTPDEIAAAAGMGRPGMPQPVNDNNRAAKAANFSAGDEMPLYISRPLKNKAAFTRWARSQGFTDIVDDLHVTVLYSRTPVDPFDLPGDWSSDESGELRVRQGGPRKVEQLGPKGAIVLRFANRYLSYRNADLIEAGASSDWPEFTPHVTITYNGAGVDLDKVEPYTGELLFGPEIFERLDTDPVDMADVAAFSADQLDTIDRFTAALLEESDPDFVRMAELLKDRVATFQAQGGPLTAEGFRIAMLQAWEGFPIDRLAERMALPFAAMHAATAAGAEDKLEV